MYIYIHGFKHTFVFIWMCVRVSVWLCEYMYTPFSTRISKKSSIHVLIYLYVCVCHCVYTCTHLPPTCIPKKCVLTLTIFIYIYVCVNESVSVWHESFICATWLIRVCNMTHLNSSMTHSYVQHDSYTCVRVRIHHFSSPFTCAFFFERYGSFMCVTWLIHMSNITHSHSGGTHHFSAPFTRAKILWAVAPAFTASP